MNFAIRTFFAALALGMATPALADCPAGNRYSFSFNSLTAQTLAYNTTYTYTATSTNLPSQTFSVLMAQNGLSSTTAGGEVRPNISSSHNAGGTTLSLVLGGIFAARTPSITGATNVISTTFTFPSPVRDMAFNVHDIDFTSNQFRDWVNVTGTGSATYTPTIATPWGQLNNTGPYTNVSSSLTLGPVTTPFTVTAQQAVGTGASNNSSTTGTLNISFLQPVTTVTMRYGNFPYQTGESSTGQQALGIDGVSYCPMPTLTMAKSSVPWSDPQNGTTNPKLIPGGDLIYTLTVTNSNASDLATADLPAIIDVLASTLTYYNGDIDDAGPLTTNFEFVPGSSGVTLTTAGVTYSNTGGASYIYSPTAGYDTNVNALRFAPGGTFAANSSFQIKFRVRVK